MISLEGMAKIDFQVLIKKRNQFLSCERFERFFPLENLSGLDLTLV